MAPLKLSFSLALSTLLIRTSNASATPATTIETTTQTQDWYAASEAKSFFRQLAQNKEQSHRQLSSFFTTSTATAAHEHEHRHLTSSTIDYTEPRSYRKSRASFAKLQKQQPLEPSDIVNSLSQYDKFWIEIKGTKITNGGDEPTSTSQSSSSSLSGPCVWSECAVNNADEENAGDNRDGDEQWFQSRTQSFCANAAYALYGRKKGEVWGRLGKCTKRHFINSFFTYGGADTLLKAIGVTPEVYYGGSSNADCVESDGDEDASQSTLGCAADGNFMIGFFDGDSCNGGSYVGGSDDFSRYNSNFEAVQCHGMSVVNDLTALSTLLSNSWACDVRTYGSRCPDPYQLKGYYEYALQAAAEGGNPIRAYNQLRWKGPLRLFSWVLMGLSFLFLFAAFSIKQCAIKKREDEGVSPNVSAMMFGKTAIELEDGGKLKNVMKTLSAKTLALASSIRSKLRCENELERTFETSSPDKQNADADDAVGYESPDTSPEENSRIDVTRGRKTSRSYIITPSNNTSRRGLKEMMATTAASVSKRMKLKVGRKSDRRFLS